MKYLKPILIFLGIISDPRIVEYEVQTENCCNLVKSGTTVRGIPPKMDELYQSAKDMGYEGPSDYRSIALYLRHYKELEIIWVHDHWSFEPWIGFA